MAATRVTNAMLADRINTIGHQIAEISTQIALLEQSQTVLAEMVAKDHVIVRGDGDNPGLLERMRDVERVLGNVSKAMWIVTAGAVAQLTAWVFSKLQVRW